MNQVMVALITPFTKEYKVDYPALKKITMRLLKEGCDGFIVCGTTGETPTLTLQERFKILKTVIEVVDQQAQIWYGCGSNNTYACIEMMQSVKELAFTGFLVVTPYYNRPSQNGIYAHYATIMKSIKKPIMLYNVPSRTGSFIEQANIEKLIMNFPQIYGLKQASNDLECVENLKKKYPDFKIYSGEDACIDEGMDCGMDGVISVMGHVFLPLIKQFLNSDRKDNHLRKKLCELAHYTFFDASPSPIKYMLNILKESENVLRLPLVPVSQTGQTIIKNWMTKNDNFTWCRHL